MEDQEDNSGRFVCPSDRQLLLRGRLKTGWCTGKHHGKGGPTPLSPEERSAILSVIKRNEAIEVAERQRVGRLVDKLDRIKMLIVDSSTPNQCRLCGHVFRFLRSPKVMCNDCQRAVCTKCCIDMVVRKAMTTTSTAPGTSLSAVSAASSFTTITTLCKLCSLQREIWKKSGAWFYKGIPKYDLPAQSATTTTQQQQPSPAHPQYHRRPIAPSNIRLQAPNFHSSDSESDDDDDVFRMFKRNRQRDTWVNTTTTKSLASTDSQSVNSSFMETQSLRSQPIGAGIGGVCVGPPDPIASAGDTESLYSTVTTTILRNSSNDSIREASVGWVEVLLAYNRVEKALQCSVIRARDLRSMDALGLADPFCKLNIVTVSEDGDAPECAESWSRTRTVHKTRNPEFNESIKFSGIEEQNLERTWLYIVLLDDDKYGHDFLGTAKIHLATMMTNEYQRISVPLEGEDMIANRAIYEGPWLRGQILVALSYNTKRRALQVLIKECTNLISMDNNGFSDPFVKIQLTPDGHKRKFRTSIKWRNLNPVFNEEFLFEARPNDLDKQTLTLSVWDKDIGKSNDFLGSLVLSGASKGRRLKQFRDCIRLPDHYHEQWHCLAAAPGTQEQHRE